MKQQSAPLPAAPVVHPIPCFPPNQTVHGQPIKSTDPRKPIIVAAFKQMTGCQKVTDVRRVKPGVFAGTALRFEGQKYEKGGRYEITIDFAGTGMES